MTAAAGALPLAPAAPAAPRLPPRPKRRLGAARVLDLLVIASVLAAAAVLVIRAEAVLGYQWRWSVIPTYLVRTDADTGQAAPNLLLLGLFTTLRVASWSLLLGIVLGTILAAMRVYGRPALRWLARLFIELLRNVPPIVLIFVLYFFVSSQVLPAIGLERALRAAPGWIAEPVAVLLAPAERVNDVLAGVLCLGLLSASYIAEIVRAGLLAVPGSQAEAGRALGLSGWAVFRLIVLPAALRNVLPALAGQFIVSIKDSALVALISIQELTFMTSEVSSTTRRFFEVWLFTASVYFCLCFACAMLFRPVERRLRRGA